MDDRLPMTLEDWERAHGIGPWSYDDMGPRLVSRYYRQELPGFRTMHKRAAKAIAWLGSFLKGAA